ncbi:MAG: carboxypeptidase M32, partial [Eubacteriaceae bacterium]|nr:carboxypeptidase M32 [Eubacteriaceae bacterium]
AAGYFGYFSCYFMANIYAAQLMEAIEEECGSFDALTDRGDFHVIKEWLKDRVFKYGALYDTADLMMKATGKTLSSDYYIEYLRRKMAEVYNL